ncbi:hypothetical protein WDW37_08420 [Bdellovibrionota bacterium FG-1]
MNLHDLKIFAEVSQALWADPHESQVAAIETLSAVSLLDLTPDRALERAASALLIRVAQQGNSASFAGVGQSFFRLGAEDRFLLVALHLGCWSYARLGRIFNRSREQIEEMAWKARMNWVTSDSSLSYPSGAPARGTRCPEYETRHPWTQRFLDEEMESGRERVFLQNHLMACDSCRQALGRCREVYYAIESKLPHLSSSTDGDAVLTQLEKICQNGVWLKTPAERSFSESLAVFGQRRNIRWAMFLLALMVIGALVHSFGR